jgi:transcriptional regulator with XRE-family HTH domain
MDVARFRERLRELRKQLVGTQAELSALTKREETDTPVNLMTISDIETGAIADPGIVTVARIVEAIPGLTLSSFFAQIEALKTSSVDGQNQPHTDIVAGALGDSSIPSPPTEAERDLYRKIGNVFLRAAASERDVAKAPRAAHPSTKGRRKR